MANKKVALVTGSNKGMGLEIARQLGQLGFTVIVSARDEAKAAASADRLRAEGADAHAVRLDMNDPQTADAAVRWASDQFGRIDVLVNNAGVNLHDEGEGSVLTVRFETVMSTFSTNVLGVWQVCKAVVPGMKERGYGRIVNVSTEMASLHRMAGDKYPPSPSYRLSKVGLNFLTVSLGKELAGTDVLINAYSPGWMKTDMGGSDAPYTVEEGSQTAVWLATLPTGGPQGQFFAEMRKIGEPVVLPW